MPSLSPSPVLPLDPTSLVQGDALLSPLLRKEEQEEGRKTEVSDKEKLTDSLEDGSVKEEPEVTEEEEVVLVEKSCDIEEKSSIPSQLTSLLLPEPCLSDSEG